MNQNILQKAIQELKSDKPKIDYVLGMLETLYELGVKEEPLAVRIPQAAMDDMKKMEHRGMDTPQDEAAMLDAKARAAVDKIKSIGGVEIT